MDPQAKAFSAQEKAITDGNAELNKSSTPIATGVSSGATPVIQTTTAARNESQANMQDFTTTQNNRAAADAAKAAAAASAPKDSTTGTSGDRGTDTTTEDPEDSSDFSSNFKGSLDNIKSWASSQIDTANTTLTKALAYSDSSTATAINQLVDMYNQRKAGIEDAYNRLGAKKQTAAFRSGLARYAPDQAAGILTDNEVQMHVAINDLMTKLQEATQKATQAKQDGDTKAFNASYKEIQDTNKEMGNQVTALYKEANTYNSNKMKETKAQADAAKATINNNINTSKSAADFILNDPDYKGMDDKGKEGFIDAYAKKIGVDPFFLTEAVHAAGAKPKGKTVDAADTDGYEEGDYIPGHGFLSPDGTVTEEKYTPSQEKSIISAGVTGKDAATYFINTPSAFQQEYIRSFDGKTSSDLQTVHVAYTDWAAKEEAKKKAAGTDNPFAKKDTSTTTPATK